MRTVDQVSLYGNWKAYYDSFSKKMIEDTDVDARNRVFNQILKKELVSAQKKGKRLSLEDAYQICAVITRRVYDLGVVSIGEFDSGAIRASMQGANFATSISCVDSMGRDYDFVHIHCFGHIPLCGLTANEISFFIDCFGGDVDDQWEILVYKVLDIQMNSYEWFQKNENRIIAMCRNATFDRVNEAVIDRYDINLGFKTKLMDRIKDYFTLRFI